MKTLFARGAALCALLWLSLPAFALDEKDLLPVDQAFALTATAPERGQVQLQFKIAPGYYLYRHRTSVKADPAFNAGALNGCLQRIAAERWPERCVKSTAIGFADGGTGG